MTDISRYEQDCGDNKHSYIADGSTNWYNQFGERLIVTKLDLAKLCDSIPTSWISGYVTIRKTYMCSSKFRKRMITALTIIEI